MSKWSLSRSPIKFTDIKIKGMRTDDSPERPTKWWKFVWAASRVRSAWFNDHVSFRALTFALRDDFRIVRQSHVHDSALFSGHRIERPCPTTGRSARRVLGDGVKLLGAAVLIAFDVDDDVGALFELAIYQHPDDELQVTQGFAAPADQQPGICAFNLKHDRPVSEFVKHVSFYLHVHSGDQVSQDLAGHLFQFFAVFDRRWFTFGALIRIV